MLGHHGHASETPFNGVSLAGRWWAAYSCIWILPPLINYKSVVKDGPPLTKLTGSAHPLQTVWAYIRPDNTMRRAWPVSKLSDALMFFPKWFFEKCNFEDDKEACKITQQTKSQPLPCKSQPEHTRLWKKIIGPDLLKKSTCHTTHFKNISTHMYDDTSDFLTCASCIFCA